MCWFGECHELVHGFIKQQLTHELLIHPWTVDSPIHHDINIVAVNYLYIYMYIYIFIYIEYLCINIVYSYPWYIVVVNGFINQQTFNGEFFQDTAKKEASTVPLTNGWKLWDAFFDRGKWCEFAMNDWVVKFQHLTWLFWSLSNKVREL